MGTMHFTEQINYRRLCPKRLTSKFLHSAEGGVTKAEGWKAHAGVISPCYWSPEGHALSIVEGGCFGGGVCASVRKLSFFQMLIKPSISRVDYTVVLC